MKKPLHKNLLEKKPPQNNEAEAAALGSCLIDPDAALHVLISLKEGDFYLKAHSAIFSAMYHLFAANHPVDVVTVLQELEAKGTAADAGGLNYLSSLTATVPSALNHKHYAGLVKQNSLRRQLILTSDEIAAEGYKGEIDDILAFAESKIFALGEANLRRDLVPIQEAVLAAHSRMEQLAIDKAAYRGVPTGFIHLEGLLNGFQNGDLIILAARPGAGKTSLGMNFVVNAALEEVEKIVGVKSRLGAAVFSLEMPAEQLARRMLCSVSRVSMSRAASGQLTDAEWARIRIKKPLLDGAQIFIDDTSAITPAEIIAKCRRLKREKRLDLVMIDYLQLMNAGVKVENRQQEISEITRALKIAAKELNIPIILLSQLSRDIERRNDKQPKLSDLRESGAIEQDADVVMFIHKPEEKDQYALDENARTLTIAKHRNGELGSMNLRWFGEYVTFESMLE